MNYSEALLLCQGQKYTMAMPLKALPTRKPVPDQEAAIYCMAYIQPVVTDVEHLPDNKV